MATELSLWERLQGKKAPDVEEQQQADDNPLLAAVEKFGIKTPQEFTALTTMTASLQAQVNAFATERTNLNGQIKALETELTGLRGQIKTQREKAGENILTAYAGESKKAEREAAQEQLAHTTDGTYFDKLCSKWETDAKAAVPDTGKTPATSAGKNSGISKAAVPADDAQAQVMTKDDALTEANRLLGIKDK